MISFNCHSMQLNGNILKRIPFETDDKIFSRADGQEYQRLVFAAYDGKEWVGELVTKGLSRAKGYMFYFTGTTGSVIKQSEDKHDDRPVQDVVLSEGWNWIGHAAFRNYSINSGIEAVSGQFSMDDIIKSRSGSMLSLAIYDGSEFQAEGQNFLLEPGIGYEIKVAQALTFRYKA